MVIFIILRLTIIFTICGLCFGERTNFAMKEISRGNIKDECQSKSMDLFYRLILWNESIKRFFSYVVGYSQVSIIRPGLIFSLRDFLYYIAIEVKEVTQQKYKTWSYNRDIRVPDNESH